MMERRIPGVGRRDRGFTLVEIMIALMILAIALTGVVALFMRTQRHNQIIAEGRSNLKAAQEVMEVVISDIKRMQAAGAAPDWATWMTDWNNMHMQYQGGVTGFFDIETTKNVTASGGAVIDFRSLVRPADSIPGHKDLAGYRAKVEIVDRSVSIGAAPFSLFEIRIRVHNDTNLSIKAEQLVTWRSTK